MLAIFYIVITFLSGHTTPVISEVPLNSLVQRLAVVGCPDDVPAEAMDEEDVVDLVVTAALVTTEAVWVSPADVFVLGSHPVDAWSSPTGSAPAAGCGLWPTRRIRAEGGSSQRAAI